MKKYNIFLSSSQTDVGLGSILHFVSQDRNVAITYDPDEERGSYAVYDSDRKEEYFGSDLIITEGDSVYRLNTFGNWENSDTDNLAELDIVLQVKGAIDTVLRNLNAALAALKAHNADVELVAKVEEAIEKRKVELAKEEPYFKR